MHRFLQYLTAPALTFGIGAFMAFNFYWKVDNPPSVPHQVISKTEPENTPLPASQHWKIMPLPENFYVEMVAFGKKGEIVLIGMIFEYQKMTARLGA